MEYVKRVYNRWTPEEDAMIREGIIPPRHPSHANCLLRARKLGFKFAKKKGGPRKSDRRDELLRKGVIPEGTDMAWAVERSRELGFSFVERVYSGGDVSEVKGMSATDRQVVSLGRGDSVRRYKTRESAATRKAAERGRRFFLMHACSSMSINDIAKTENCTRQNVHRLIDTFKIHYFNEHCYDEVARTGEDGSGLS